MEYCGYVLNCTCVIEKIDKAGAVLKKQILKKAILEIGRNQFEDIVLKIASPKGCEGNDYTRMNCTMSCNGQEMVK